jgi:hypothetical protein
LKKCKFKTTAIRLDICQTGNSGYYEIDAIQLIGKTSSSGDDETEFAPYQFQKPLDEGFLSDIIVEVGSQDFHLHKCILSQNNLCKDIKEKTKVKLDIFTAESFKPIKTLLYKGFLSGESDDAVMEEIFGKVPAGDVVDLIFTLRDNHLEDIEKMVHHRLNSLIEQKTVLEVLSRMEEYIRKSSGKRFDQTDPIKKMCFECFADLYSKWPVSKEFNNQFFKLDDDLQVELLTSAVMDGEAEEAIYSTDEEDEEEEEEIEKKEKEEVSMEDDMGFDLFGSGPPPPPKGTGVTEKIKLDDEIKPEEDVEAPKSALQRHLEKIMTSGEYSDFVLKSKDGKSYKLHKLLFVGDSPYFHQLFKDSTVHEVILEYPSSIVDFFVQWTYTRLIKVKKEIQKELVDLAKKYEVKLLVDALEGNIEAPVKSIPKGFNFGWVLWTGSNGTTINKETVTRTGGNGLDRCFGDSPLQEPVHYFEVELVVMPNGIETYIGITNNLSNTSSRKNISVQMAGSYKNLCNGKNSFWKQGDTVGVYCDFKEGKVYFLKNGEPTGISGKMNKNSTYFAVCHFNYSGDQYKLKFPKTLPKNWK